MMRKLKSPALVIAFVLCVEDKGTVNTKKRTSFLRIWMPILFFVYFVCGFVVWMFFCLYIIFCAVYYFISHLICH